MSIRYIRYTKEQLKDMVVSGYSLYVNGSYWNMYDYITTATKEAYRYATFNEVEIYPVLKQRRRS